MSDEIEKRLRKVEQYCAGHEPEIVQRWKEQDRINETLRSSTKILFKRTDDMPTLQDFRELKETVQAGTTTQAKMVNLLERKKGRDEVLKVLVTFALTVAAGLGVYFLTH